MASEISGEQMQAKIAAARRDAEGLKDKIKRKKDDLADTSRKSQMAWPSPLRLDNLPFSTFRKFGKANQDLSSPRRGSEQYRCST